MQPAHLAVAVGEPAVAGHLQIIGLAAQHPLGRVRQPPGVASPAISASIISRPETPSSGPPSLKIGSPVAVVVGQHGLGQTGAMNERADAQLRVIKAVTNALCAAGISAWLFGG